MAWNEPGGNGNNHDPWNNGGKKDDRGNRGQRGPEQGPPDLDEALRKVQDRLNGIFGGKKGGSGAANGNGGSSSGGFGFLAVIVVIVALFWAGMGFYTVDQPERGVVLRLGKFHEIVQPGLHWNAPLIDNVQKVNVDVVRTDDHRSLMLTTDENIVDVDMTVQYVAADPRAYALNVRDPENSLKQAAESALRQVVGATDMHAILTEGRETLAIQVQERLQRYMELYKTGIRIAKVNIKNAQAPSQVQAAFDDVIKAREDEQRAKNEAETYANGVVPEARGNAQRIIEEANAYREEVVAKAKGETDRFNALVAQYQKAPEVTRQRLYLETMEEILGKTPKVLLDDKEGSNNMMYLPLDKLMERQNQMRSQSSNNAVRLDDASLQKLTDEVANQLRQRSTTTREAR